MIKTGFACEGVYKNVLPQLSTIARSKDFADDRLSREARLPQRSVEETEDLATDVLGTGLVVVHDTLVGGQDDDTELTRGEHSVAEVLELVESEIETGRDDTALVEATVKVDDDLAIASIIDNLELVDVAVLLHDTEELDQDLRDGSEDNLH